TLGAEDTHNATLIITAAGSLTIGDNPDGLILLTNSVLDNSGTITLPTGGHFTDDSSVTNNSTGVINVTGGTLTIDTTVTVTNAGTFEISGDDTHVTVDTATIDNTSGTIQVDAGSVPGTNDPTLELKSAEIDNGSITNAGLLEATSGNNIIKNVNDD